MRLHLILSGASSRMLHFLFFLKRVVLAMNYKINRGVLENPLYMVVEYCSEGTLYTHICRLESMMYNTHLLSVLLEVYAKYMSVCQLVFYAESENYVYESRTAVYENRGDNYIYPEIQNELAEFLYIADEGIRFYQGSELLACVARADAKQLADEFYALNFMAKLP